MQRYGVVAAAGGGAALHTLQKSGDSWHAMIGKLVSRLFEETSATAAIVAA
jgi:hypothetical protein